MIPLAEGDTTTPPAAQLWTTPPAAQLWTHKTAHIGDGAAHALRVQVSLTAHAVRAASLRANGWL